MKKLYLQVIASSLLASPFYAEAQVSALGNAGISSNYVGWDNTNNFPLQIKHEGIQQPILFKTGTDINSIPIERMRINGEGTTSFLDLTVNVSGYVGIGVTPDRVLSRLTITGTNNSGQLGSVQTL